MTAEYGGAITRRSEPGERGPEGPRPAPVPLEVVAHLLRRMHQAEIEYCHWKSNEHLQESLAGETDLDLLVARREVQRLTGLLADLGFRRCLSAPVRSYPAIESHLGFDAETGRLVHLHVHYQLTLGERYLKGYRVPWEQRLLATRRFSRTEGIYVADPHLELLLLIVRAALKLRTRDRLRALMGKGGASPGLQREFAWLAGRVERPRLDELASTLLGPKAAGRLDAMIDDGRPDVRSLTDLRAAIDPPLEEYRTFRPLEARGRRWLRGLAFRWGGRRRLPQGGVVIALVGADGSGKSTVTTELGRWLSAHLDLRSIYFGSGQGSASGLRRALRGAVNLARRARPARRPRARASRRETHSGVRSVVKIVWVISLALERTRRAAEARRARNRGLIVLCDRFPQSQWGVSDGPTIRHWREDPSWVRRLAARRELAAIEAAERVRPDLVIRLNVTPEVALHRKPDTPPELLQAKLAALGQLQFPPETSVVDADATLPLEQVLLDVKRQIWAYL